MNLLYKKGDSNDFLIPAWRKGKLGGKVTNGDIKHIIKPHSLSVSTKPFRFYNVAKSLYSLNIDPTHIGAIFGTIASSKQLKLEDDSNIIVTMETRTKDDATTIILSHTRNDKPHIVIRSESIKEMVKFVSLLQMQAWCNANTLLANTKSYFNFDPSKFDILESNILRLL